MFEQRRNNPVDQRAEQPGSLQAGNLLLLKGMLHIGLNTGEMTPESANGRVSGDSAALPGDASESVRKQGRRSLGARGKGIGVNIALIVLLARPCNPARAT